MGHSCARLLNAKCVSTALSKSYKEESLRFTCQNGHNFFLSISKLRKTHNALISTNGESPSSILLANLDWCNKCTKFYAKVKTLASRLSLRVCGGLHSQRIELACLRSSHRFSIPYHKKLEQLGCLKCRSDDKELLREQMLREEELRAQELRNEQEKFFAEAKQLMDKEFVNNCANAKLNSNHHSSLKCSCTSCLATKHLHANQASSSSCHNTAPFSGLEEQINRRASALAKAFLSSLNAAERQNDKLSFQKVFLALKLSETPNEMLLEGLKLMGDSEQTRSYFKKLAKLVHPDKNGHPLAHQSFQKLSDAT
mmetsp:Transcript_25862/g.34601  ORF Transcript_25862/g.34601 Transcript_25862/m.34601 type:complete len:312 (+) Transcript_25862:1034-1969(+)